MVHIIQKALKNMFFVQWDEPQSTEPDYLDKIYFSVKLF